MTIPENTCAVGGFVIAEREFADAWGFMYDRWPENGYRPAGLSFELQKNDSCTHPEKAYRGYLHSGPQKTIAALGGGEDPGPRLRGEKHRIEGINARGHAVTSRAIEAGWVIVALNPSHGGEFDDLLHADAGAGVDGWLAMNSAPSIFVFCLGYLLRQRPLMTARSAWGDVPVRDARTLRLRLGRDESHPAGRAPRPHDSPSSPPSSRWSASAVRGRSLRRASPRSRCSRGWQWDWFGRHPEVLQDLMDGTCRRSCSGRGAAWKPA